MYGIFYREIYILKSVGKCSYGRIREGGVHAFIKMAYGSIECLELSHIKVLVRMEAAIYSGYLYTID